MIRPSLKLAAKKAFSKMQLIAVFLLFGGVASLSSGRAQIVQGKSASTSAMQSSESSYGSALPISSGDLVQIDVFGSPELSGRYRVSQGGDVDLILGGSFHISGLSAGEAAVRVEELLRTKDIVKEPHVNVFVREYSSQGVTILGEVKNPGVYPSLGEHRLYDLIASAGGFTATASNRVTILHGGDATQPQIIELSNMALTDGTNDVPLRPGDRVVVGTGGIVYVIGDVGRPGGFVLSRTDSQLSVLKVLSLAGGFNHTAKLGSTSILTQTANGLAHRDIDLRDIVRHKVPDPVLAPGDVLYVPASTAKIVGYRSLEAAFAAASSVSVVLASR